METMETVNNIINQLLIPLLSTVLLAVAGYIGVRMKKSLDEKEKNKTFLEIIARSVCATEQIYKKLHGEEKLRKCVEIANGMLASRGIEISEEEIIITIESVLAELNNAFEKDSDEEPQPKEIKGFQAEEEQKVPTEAGEDE